MKVSVVFSPSERHVVHDSPAEDGYNITHNSRGGFAPDPVGTYVRGTLE